MAGIAPFSAQKNPCIVGGSGHEFDVGATTDSSCVVTYATNYNGCQQGLCTPPQGLGSTPDVVAEDVTSGPATPGGYRIEIEPTSGHTRDYFIEVSLARNTSDTNVISTAPVASDDGNGNWVVVWKDNADACTYTWTHTKDGAGGGVTATGICTGGTI